MSPGPGRRQWLAVLASAWLAAWTQPVGAAGRPVSLASLDGTMLAGTFFEAEARPSPGVVLVHMLHRSRSDWDDIGGRLAAAGVSALAIDLRGHGGSGGLADALPDMAQDVRASLRWLAARPEARPGALGVVGASLGANLALTVAADEPAVSVVAAISPSLDYQGLRVGPDVMRRIGDRPVWLAASTEDPLALRTVKELIGPGARATEQYVSPATGHGTNLVGADGNLARALVDWLCRRLLS